MLVTGTGTSMKGQSLCCLGALKIKCHEQGIHNFFIYTFRTEFIEVSKMQTQHYHIIIHTYDNIYTF